MERFLYRKYLSIEDIRDFGDDEMIVLHRFLKDLRHGRTEVWTEAQRIHLNDLINKLALKDTHFFTKNHDTLTVLLDLIKLDRYQTQLDINEWSGLLDHPKRYIKKRALQILNLLNPFALLGLEPILHQMISIVPSLENRTFFVLEPGKRDMITFREAVKLYLNIQHVKKATIPLETSQLYLKIFSDHDSEMLWFLEKSLTILDRDAQFYLFLLFLDMIDFDHTALMDIYLVDREVCHRYLDRVTGLIVLEMDAFGRVCQELQNTSPETDYMLSFFTCIRDTGIHLSSFNDISLNSKS